MSDATIHLVQAARQKRRFPDSQFYLPFGQSGLYEAVTNLSIALDPAFSAPETMGDVGYYINLSKGYEEDLAALVCAGFIFTYLLEG